ncbi:hypothetical protein C1Y40_05819 [Mycobacterium talmoniae]|uniref:Uncharacterized protein n=1 Tax=Mycobacterium talmoniae TaxID=1858794 RepID=A0A2S8BBJ6_9MYCO|nr:hypothetical protein C1Y40_05819 [Mycobacterium talmoniae]
MVSQFSAAARDSSSGPLSPRTTASTTLASIRESQVPRASAASAYDEAAVKARSRLYLRMPTVRAVTCSSERASTGTASSKNSMVTRTMSTVWRSAMCRARSWGTSSNAWAV